MPSSHAQFTAFWAVYMSLFLLVRYTPDAMTSAHRDGNPESSSRSRSKWRKLRVYHTILAAGCMGLAAATAGARVYLRYHSARQVLAGAAVGGVLGFVWFVGVGLARYWGWVDRALDLKMAGWLRVRDLVVSEDLVEVGYKEWNAKRYLRKMSKAKKRK